ncbi:MAG TPA: DUF1343 domain-containing protein [Thermotogota bacterium]|nr:DUF1343 domain-containing protein [Thermotogota bacterium]HRW92428.1 DUF1343 domain-containing protein [Thermotogota bacterium]
MKTVLGLDQLEENIGIFSGKRLGLITNYSGVNSQQEENISLFVKNGLDIQKVFAPEHGLYGIADGQAFADGTHPEYGMPVLSLYGDRKKPREQDVEGLDLLVFDIQDVGLRYYTFLYTLAYALEAAAEFGLPFVVLDRPNPLGGQIVSGRQIPDELASFVGGYRLPVRYGLTIGECAYYFKDFLHLDVDLSVVTLKNYDRSTTFPDTGLLWNFPSPALPTYESVMCYSGGCFFEATNVSEGRGTTRAFQVYGAPWLDMEKTIHFLRQRVFDGITFRKRTFVPFSSKHQNQVCFGIEFFPLHPRVDAIGQMLYFLQGVYQLHRNHFSFVEYADVNRLDSLTGDPRVVDMLEGKMELDALLEDWKKSADAFATRVEPLRIYA